MPTTRRSRTVTAPLRDVWRVVGDPHHLPRWWPRAARVEDVADERWTVVLATRKGKGVRVDYRALETDPPRRWRFEQAVAGTPFERILAEAVTEIRLEEADGDATAVTIELRQRIRGLNKLGGFMFARASRRTLDDALERLDEAVGR